MVVLALATARELDSASLALIGAIGTASLFGDFYVKYRIVKTGRHALLGRAGLGSIA